MEDFNSKHTGQTIEDVLDSILAGGGGGGASPDLSDYATKEELNDKVDKVEGKQLSTEDFTTALKDKLNSLNNYDDTEIIEAINTLRSDFNTLVSGDTTTAIKSFNDIIAFLNGIEDSQSLDSIIASIEQQIAAKGTVKSIKINGTTKTPDTSGMVDLGTIEGGGNNTFIFDWDGTSTSGSLTEEMFNKAMSAESIIIRIVNIDDNTVDFYEAEYIRKSDDAEFCAFTIHRFISNTEIRNVTFILYPSSWNAVSSTIEIPTKTSQLNNDSKFVRSDNLKTINGESILGSGNIEISGGSGGGKEYVKVTLSEGYLVFMDNAENNRFSLEPNKVYYVDSFVSDGVSIQDVVPPTGDVGEYTVHFVCSGSNFVDTFEVPANWQWANGQKPTLENGTAYELSVVATKANGTYFYKAVLTAFKRV